MKILPVAKTFPCFKSKLVHQKKQNRYIWFDDLMSVQNREYIRQDFENRVLPFFEIYSQGRLSDYELNKLLNSLKPKKTAHSFKIDNLDVFNLKPLSKKKHSYRGSTLLYERMENVKNSGINTIIDIANFSALGKAAIEAGLSYIDFEVPEDFSLHPAFVDEQTFLFSEIITHDDLSGTDYEILKEKIKKQYREKSREFVEKFKRFINEMKKDNFYIGCDFGTYQTDKAMLINYFFNSTSEKDEPKPALIEKYWDNIYELYKKLTPQDKFEIGFSENFEIKFLEEIGKYAKD